MKCLVCGNVWEARGNSFFNSRRTSGCDYCNRRTPANIHDISVLVEYASKHGGSLCSKKYVKRNHIYKWQCEKGHKFEANFNNMKYRNQFCPLCESRQIRQKINQLEAEKLFLSFGYLLVDLYRTKKTRSNVNCSICGSSSTKSLEQLEAGQGKCRPCLQKNKIPENF